MRQGIGITAALVLAVAAASCTAGRPQTAPAERTRNVFSYVVEASSPAELVGKSQAVVLARPVRAEPQTLLTRDDVRILGVAFEVVDSVAGPVTAGTRITVVRTETSGGVLQEPSYAAPFYLLALSRTDDSYSVAAWYVVGGPSGRIAFASAGGRAGAALVETAGNPVQEALKGRSYAQARRIVLGS